MSDSDIMLQNDYRQYSVKSHLKWLLNRNRLTDIENKFMVTKGESGGGNWEFGINRYTRLYIKQINSKDLLWHRELYSVSCYKL